MQVKRLCRLCMSAKGNGDVGRGGAGKCCLDSGKNDIVCKKMVICIYRYKQKYYICIVFM